MKWRVQAIGRPALDYARRGIAEYEKRLRRLASVELDFFGKDKGAEANGSLHLQRSEGALRIALDERGEAWTTSQLVDKINQWEQRGTKRIALLIGGADGHDSATRQASDLTWALSPLTLQHELALLVLLEQIYRAYTIKRGEPYHR